MKNNLEIFSDADKCPVRNVLDRISDKWSILVLLLLGETEMMRFSELQKAIGEISQKMLTVTLRKLEADDLVDRTIYPEIPPRVEYQITGRGKTLLPHIHNLAAWASENMADIKKSRADFASK